MANPAQRIPLKNSPLYKLSSKVKLAKLLGCPTQFIHKYKSTRGQYKLFTLPKPGTKERRPVEEPKEFIKKIHGRLKGWLCAIEVPEYLKSGVKGKSHIDNAKTHTDSDFCVTMDLHHFYQMGQKMFLCHMFQTTFLMPNDIALFLSDIATIPQKKKDGTDSYFPTGSPLSQILIFWCYKQLFDDIDVLCRERGITFSLYVDDMTFSSKRKIPKSFENLIKKRIESVKLELNEKKTKRYDKHETKIVTGCAIKDKRLSVRNKKRHDVVNTLNKLEIDKMSVQDIRPTLGKITSQQQIEPKIFDHTKRQLLARQKAIKKSRKKTNIKK